MALEPKLHTIKINEQDLREALQFKIKSIQRAINSGTNEDINTILQKVIDRLNQAIASINQHELPLKKP